MLAIFILDDQSFKLGIGSWLAGLLGSRRLVCAEFLVNEGQGGTLGPRALVPWLTVSGSGGDYTQAAAS